VGEPIVHLGLRLEEGKKKVTVHISPRPSKVLLCKYL